MGITKTVLLLSLVVALETCGLENEDTAGASTNSGDTTTDEGDDTTTDEGDDTTTDEGDDTTTDEGDDTTTGEGDDTTTGEGDDTTTGEGEPVCYQAQVVWNFVHQGAHVTIFNVEPPHMDATYVIPSVGGNHAHEFFFSERNHASIANFGSEIPVQADMASGEGVEPHVHEGTAFCL